MPGRSCVIRGCVPKKLLVYSSQFADEFSDAGGFGWTVGSKSHDWSALIKHKVRREQGAGPCRAFRHAMRAGPPVTHAGSACSGVRCVCSRRWQHRRQVGALCHRHQEGVMQKLPAVPLVCA